MLRARAYAMPQVMRTMLGIMAGFLAINAIVIGFTLVSVNAMHQQSGHPTPGYLVWNVVYSFVAALVGGVVVALIARAKAMTAAAALAAIMLFFGIFSYLHYKGTQPLWYQALLTLGPPAVTVAGAAMYRRGRQNTA